MGVPQGRPSAALAMFRTASGELLPTWFADSNPTANALLTGAATALAFVYGLYVYAVAQSRILTATGIWLDMIAQDFYGTAVQRSANQDDDSFRAIIVANLFRRVPPGKASSMCC